MVDIVIAVLSVIGTGLVISVIIAIVCCCKRSPGQRGQVNYIGNNPAPMGPNVQFITIPQPLPVYPGVTNQQNLTFQCTQPSMNGNNNVAHVQLQTTEAPPSYESITTQPNNTPTRTHAPQSSSNTPQQESNYQPLAHRETRTDDEYTLVGSSSTNTYVEPQSSSGTYTTMSQADGPTQGNHSPARDSYLVPQISSESYLTMSQAVGQTQGNSSPARDSYLVPQSTNESYLTMPQSDRKSDVQYESIDDYTR